MREAWLDELEKVVAGVDAGTAVVTVASVAGRDVPRDDHETRAAARRALLVLAAGGDPERGLALDGPAVLAFAGEIDQPRRREQLHQGLARLREDAVGLPHVSEVVAALVAAPETAWRAYACALLAEALVED